MKTEVARLQALSLPRRAARSVAAVPLPLGMALMGCAAGALNALRSLSIAVAGCGSVGGRIALLLARMGFGSLLLVDPKKYKEASLATHEIGPENIGQPKVMDVARRCKAINPSARVGALFGPVEALDLAALAAVDLVVMAPDLLPVEVELGQRCLWLGKPLVQASVHGTSLTIQIRFFLNAKGGAGGCPACGYGRVEWDLLSRQVRFSCEGVSDPSPPPLAAAPATNSLSAVCSLAADLAALQIVRFFLKLGQPVADAMLEYNGFTHRTVISALPRNPQCRLDHSTFALPVVGVPLAGLSLAQVSQHASGGAVTPDAQFEVEGMTWVELGACRCAQPTLVRRFVPRNRPESSRCSKCHSPLVPLSFYTHRVVGASVLGPAVEQPLHRLGARRVSSVIVRTGASGALVRCKPPAQESK